MRIGIIGAAGKAGRAIFRECLRRGELPTAIVRDSAKAQGMLGEYAVCLEREARKLTAADLRTFDVIVDAIGTTASFANQHVEVTKHLVKLVQGNDKPRLVFILRAASLLKDGRLYLDELYERPGTSSWIAVPEQQTRQLRLLESTEGVNWVGVTPSIEFVQGPAGRPVLGRDEVLYGPAGGSRVTTGTLAVAVLDEITNPQHHNERFTVRDENC